MWLNITGIKTLVKNPSTLGFFFRFAHSNPSEHTLIEPERKNLVFISPKTNKQRLRAQSLMPFGAERNDLTKDSRVKNFT